jgi:hypothetical protein
MKPEIFPDIPLPSPEFSQNPFKSVRGPVLRQCGLILIKLFKKLQFNQRGQFFPQQLNFMATLPGAPIWNLPEIFQEIQ